MLIYSSRDPGTLAGQSGVRGGKSARKRRREGKGEKERGEGEREGEKEDVGVGTRVEA